MTDKFDIEYLEEGDSFEGSPIEQSAFISEVLAASGLVEIQGNKVFITSLPKKATSEAKAPASPKKAAEAPKKTEPKVDPEVAIAPAPKAKAKPIAPAPKAKVEVFKPEPIKDVSDDKTKE